MKSLQILIQEHMPLVLPYLQTKQIHLAPILILENQLLKTHLELQMLIGLEIQSKPNNYQFISFMLYLILLLRTNIPYLIWKSNYWIFWPTKIQIRRIQEDGLSFLDENPSTPILTAQLFHEVHCVEGPWMIYKYQLEIVIDLKKNRQICIL